MGNNLSLEENDNEDQGNSNNGVELKPVSSNESGENSNDAQPMQQTMVKKTKRVSSDFLKKRRLTSKNNNASALKKTKTNRRR